VKTDKLYYQLFLSQPSLLADLLPGLPADCEFEYSAPVIKEGELRLDGLLVPVSDNPQVPVIFLEAQMQSDARFYGRYFAEIYLYLYQYQVERPWRGLIILQSEQQGLGCATPYEDLLTDKVQRIYLQALIGQTQLPPALALLQLIVLPDAATPPAAQTLLKNAQTQGEEAFQQTLNWVEAILINKFPQLTSEEILSMLDIKTADITQTRFYQEVFQEGREEGREEARHSEAMLLIRLLTRLLGTLPDRQQEQIRSLSFNQLEALGDTLLDFSTVADVEAWLMSDVATTAQDSGGDTTGAH
jgi:predicted transposase/invertase (TIGR01784 family)